MFCKNCGSQVPEGSPFCPQCGTATQQPAQVMQEIPAPAPVPAAPQPEMTPVTPQQPVVGQPIAAPTPVYGQPLSQSSNYGQQPAATPQPTAAPQASAFGQPPVMNQQPAFGQPPMMNQQPTYGQSVFGQPAAASGFGGTATGFGGSSATAKKPIPFRLAGKIMIVLALLCFFLPFVSVSCSMGASGGDQELGKFTGFDMITGNMEMDTSGSSLGGLGGSSSSKYDDEWDDNNSTSSKKKDESKSEKEKMNYWLIAAAACGAVALGVLFIKGKKLEVVSGGLCAAAAILVIIARATFKSFYGFDEALKEQSTSSSYGDLSQYIKVNTKIGLILCVGLFAVAAIACILEFLNEKKKEPASSFEGQTPLT